LASRPRFPRNESTRRRAQAALLLALGAAGCGIVDAGPPTGPPQGCNASPSFFVEHTWPEYLDRYPSSGQGCGQASCHDAQSGQGYFRLSSVAAAPAFDDHQPTSAWPDAWRSNLMSAARLLNCSDPISSLLLTVPEGRGQPHPPGDVVGATNHDTANQVIQDWANAR
jgi:hypothetical protein